MTDALNKATDAFNKATDADHKAELFAQKLNSHLENCVERYKEQTRRYEKLEEDIQSGFLQQNQSTNRVHSRIDGLLRAFIGGALTIVILGLGAFGTVIWYVITKKIGE